ncbi:hypothetical protein JW979_15240 [bacterium]|nr:hypothetical protein [candidate division CSSED10-310 bacterium]
MKLVTCCAIGLLMSVSCFALNLTFMDPSGDDDGSGSYIYPTDRVYLPGSFDLRSMTVKSQGNMIIFEITVNAKLENPWEMESGFSIQMAQIYIDKDGKAGSGHSLALPGINAAFLPEAYWEKVVIVSPQPVSRVKTEINAKAPELASSVVIPLKVIPRGKTIVATVNRDDLGFELTADTGFQVILTSNEGFPDGNEILTRKVNEYEGQHRFGGGSDYSGDPHFMDIFWPPAQGSDQEITGQHNCLSQYVSSPDPGQNVFVKLPVVRAVESATSIARSTPEESQQTTMDTRTIAFESPPAQPRDFVQMGEFGMTWNGKIYTSWLYGNDVSQASVYVDPFQDGGHNGINSELELTVNARVSEYVEAGARIKNRFRKNYWATYWNNTDLDEAQYMKLRGVWVRFKPPEWITPYIDSVHVGSSDLGMFSPWTVGRIRYIDRDNAMGTFISGTLFKNMSYEFGRISLPEPWAGPGWTTRGKGYFTAEGFFTRDFAYAGAFNFDIHDRFRFRLVGDYTIDREGDPDDDNTRDGVEWITRFENTVISAEFDASPFSFMDISGVAAYAETNYKALFDYIEKKGANPIPQKDTDDMAFKILMEINDPFDIGLSFAVEYFNIGEDYVSLMAARRETDVLLTEGFEADDAPGAFDWGGWSGTMGQVPTLNVDNYDTQFDETCYQTIVGWKGETLLASYQRGAFDISAEYTMIDYNTNMQNRDMGTYYDGGGFSAPGNAYNEFQDRFTNIAVIKGSYAFQAGRSWDVDFRVKHINDEDDRDTSINSDNYKNDKWIYEIALGCRIFDELHIRGGYTLYDKEITLGDSAYDSTKNRYFFKAQYNFGGVRIGYLLEQFTGKDWDDVFSQKYDDWNLIRSHAFIELAF